MVIAAEDIERELAVFEDFYEILTGEEGFMRLQFNKLINRWLFFSLLFFLSFFLLGNEFWRIRQQINKYINNKFYLKIRYEQSKGGLRNIVKNA